MRQVLAVVFVMVPAPGAVPSTHLVGPCTVCSGPSLAGLWSSLIQDVAMLSVLGRGPQVVSEFSFRPHGLVKSAACYPSAPGVLSI